MSCQPNLSPPPEIDKNILTRFWTQGTELKVNIYAKKKTPFFLVSYHITFSTLFTGENIHKFIYHWIRLLYNPITAALGSDFTYKIDCPSPYSAIWQLTSVSLQCYVTHTSTFWTELQLFNPFVLWEFLDMRSFVTRMRKYSYFIFYLFFQMFCFLF